MVYLLIEHLNEDDDLIELSIHGDDDDAMDCPVMGTTVEAVAHIAEEVLESMRPEIYEKANGKDPCRIVVAIHGEGLNSRVAYRIEPAITSVGHIQSIPQMVALQTLVRIQQQMDKYMKHMQSFVETPVTLH